MRTNSKTAHFTASTIQVDVSKRIGRSTQSSEVYEVLRNQNKHFRQETMLKVLAKLEVRRKRYSFQVIKQFFLFPDETISSNCSIDTYDRIFFTDEHVHTIVKIYETKEMERKIWAFLNLKALRMRQKLQKMTHNLEKFKKEKEHIVKKTSFYCLRQFSLSLLPKVQPQRPSIIHEQSKINTQIYRKEQIRSTENITKVEPKPPQIIRVQAPLPVEKKYEPSVNVRGGYQLIYPTNCQPSTYKVIQNRRQFVTEPAKVYVRQQAIPARRQFSNTDYLVHTVHGNCTINVNCTYSNGQKKQTEAIRIIQESEKKKRQIHEINRGEKSIEERTILEGDQTERHQHERSHHTYQHSASTTNPCCHQCHYSCVQQCIYSRLKQCCCNAIEKDYDMDSRLEYLEYLERISAEMSTGKGTKRY